MQDLGLKGFELMVAPEQGHRGDIMLPRDL